MGIVGILTVAVSALGYLREAALAARFGVSATMDAYFGAIFIPNIVYSALIAGTLSPVLIPILLHGNADESSAKLSEKVSVIANIAMLALAAIIVPGLLFAHLWLPLLFPGFDSQTAALAVRLTYVIFPAVLFLALAGILTAVLNGHHKFTLAAFAPALSSLTVMGAALGFSGSKAIYFVGVATAVGFLLQAFLLVPAVGALGIRYRPVFDVHHPAIRKLIKMGVPLFLYLAAANAALLLERNLASRISAGSVSTLSYALRLFTVPSNFLAAPLATVAYPSFAREAARERGEGLARQVSEMFRLVVFLFLPITIWLILNALPVTRLLYERGHFLASDSLATARVLGLYGAGILPIAVAVVLLRCYFAIEDTFTPLAAELAALVVFLFAAPYLTHRFGIGGLVVTRAITFFLVTSILLAVLWKKYHLLEFDLETLWFFLRVLAATSVMAAFNWAVLHALQSTFAAGNTFMRLGIVMVLAGGSAAIFLAAATLLRLFEAKKIISTARGWLRAKAE